MEESEKKQYKKQREDDINAILNSAAPIKVVVAGPGTGKTFLFGKLIKKKINEGKTKFLAITFVGRLADALADDLAGMTKTFTLHSFAYNLLKSDSHVSQYQYFPDIKKLIDKDLELLGISPSSPGETEYKKRTAFYKAFGDDDIIIYAVKYLKRNPDKIPLYDLVLIDEFQDFNEQEAELIEILSSKNEIVIVGDDDQALYIFKGSDPKFIRDEYKKEEENISKHTMRYCSRCTEPIINVFTNIVNSEEFKSLDTKRVNKEYLCYLPEKEEDNLQNPELITIENVPIGAISSKILQELKDITADQKIKTVLVIGEAQKTKNIYPQIYKLLRKYGFKNVTLSSVSNFEIIDNKLVALKLLKEDSESSLGWRILASDIDEEDLTSILNNQISDDSSIKSLLEEDFVQTRQKLIRTFQKLQTNTPSTLNTISEEDMDKFEEKLLEKPIDKKVLLAEYLQASNEFLPRPLCNIEITITSILGAKGLGADVVFLIGFDQGILPKHNDIELAEFYQFLVAITRAKKRVYCINSNGKPVSKFKEYLDLNNLSEE